MFNYIVSEFNDIFTKEKTDLYKFFLIEQQSNIRLFDSLNIVSKSIGIGMLDRNLFIFASSLTASYSTLITD